MIGRDLPRSNASGGVSGQIDLLAGSLASSGNHVTVFALNPPAGNAGYEYRPILLPNAVRKHRRVALYLLPWLVSRIPLEQFDVVHAHGDDQFIRTRRPVVRTFYGTERAEARYSTTLRHRLYHWSMVPFELVSQRRASAVVAISRSCQRQVARRSVVIPCGYDPSFFYPGGNKSAHPSILFVGELRSRKRAELLLKKFSTVVKPAVPEAELWIVATGTVSAPGVRSHGHMQTRQLADLYRQAWVYCMPSSYEGFGVPYVEAMASGTPVVATPNGGAEEVLDGGRAGRLATEQELGAELVRLLTDASLRQALIEKGLVRAAEYSISRIAQQYLALYQELTNSDPLTEQ